MEFTKEYLSSLSYDELEKLYDRYYAMGYNALRFDINQGMAILDIADKIEAEIKSRGSNVDKKIKIKTPETI